MVGLDRGHYHQQPCTPQNWAVLHRGALERYEGTEAHPEPFHSCSHCSFMVRGSHLLALTSPFNHFSQVMAHSRPQQPLTAPSPRLPPSVLFPCLSKPSVTPLQCSCRFIVNFGSAVSDLGSLPPLFALVLAA